jgi:hypothetical protein
MRESKLFRLHLGSALHYEAFAVETGPQDSCLPADDCIWVFNPGDLESEDRDSGPKVRRPFPCPAFAGSSSKNPSGESSSLPPGKYFFSQWRESEYHSIEDGLEDFIRQVWWEGENTEGPWILRIVSEDNERAYQGLRLMRRN